MLYGVGFNSQKYGHRAYTPRPENKQTPAYQVWANMISRCYNPNADSYPRYGAKGITVCSAWHDFQEFAEWFYANYIPNTQIDKDFKGGKEYSPSSCIFVTKQENVSK